MSYAVDWQHGPAVCCYIGFGHVNGSRNGTVFWHLATSPGDPHQQVCSVHGALCFICTGWGYQYSGGTGICRVSLWCGFFPGESSSSGVNLCCHIFCPVGIWITDRQSISVYQRGCGCGQCVVLCSVDRVRRELSCDRITSCFAGVLESSPLDVWHPGDVRGGSGSFLPGSPGVDRS
jgi:hypothetical protein